jgi:hypothetical protein
MTERGATQEILAQLMELEEDGIIVGFIRRYRKQRTRLRMTDTSRRRNLSKEICFSSMIVNTCNTQESSGCIG